MGDFVRRCSLLRRQVASYGERWLSREGSDKVREMGGYCREIGIANVGRWVTWLAARLAVMPTVWV